MVNLRRWLVTSAPCPALTGAFLISMFAGCQTMTEHRTPDAGPEAVPLYDASSPGTAPLPAPAPYVETVSPMTAAPYEETIDETAPAVTTRPAPASDAVPGPEALLATEPSETTGLPVGRESYRPLVDEPAAPARTPSPAGGPLTVQVDDVAPAPEPVIDTSIPESSADDDSGQAVRQESRSLARPASPALPIAADSLPEEADAQEIVAGPSAVGGTPDGPAAQPLPATDQSDLPGLPNFSPEPVIPGVTPGSPVETPAVPARQEQNERWRSDEHQNAPVSTTAAMRPLFPTITSSSRKEPVLPARLPVSAQPVEITRSGLPVSHSPAPDQARAKTSAENIPIGRGGIDSTSRFDSTPLDRAAHSSTILTTDSEITGIAFDQHGNLLVTSAEGLSQVTPTGLLRELVAIDSARGLVPLPDGGFAVCDARRRSLLHVGATGSPVSTLAQRSDGHFLRAPSYAAVDAVGGIYFTDPGYARITAPTGRLHYVSPAGGVNLVSQRLAYPQGIALSADGKSLYLVESQLNRVVKFTILSPGRVGPLNKFCHLPPGHARGTDDFATDMTIDEHGRLYVARHGMQQIDLIDSGAQLLRSIPTGDVQPVSLLLSEDQTELFVAGASAAAPWSGIVQRVPVRQSR